MKFIFVVFEGIIDQNKGLELGEVLECKNGIVEIMEMLIGMQKEYNYFKFFKQGMMGSLINNNNKNKQKEQ